MACPALRPMPLCPAPEQPLRLRFHSPAGLPGSFFWSWKVLFLCLSLFSSILVLLALPGRSWVVGLGNTRHMNGDFVRGLVASVMA